MNPAMFKLLREYEHTIWREWGPFEPDRWKNGMRKKLKSIKEPFTEEELEKLYTEVHEGFVWG